MCVPVAETADRPLRRVIKNCDLQHR